MNVEKDHDKIKKAYEMYAVVMFSMYLIIFSK